MPLAETGKHTIPLFRRGKWYSSLDYTPVAANGFLSLSLAPDILLRDDSRWTRGNLPNSPKLSRREVERILYAAMDMFVRGTLIVPPFGVQSPQDFQAILWDHLGLPQTLVQQWSSLLELSLEKIIAGASAKNESLSLVSLPANTFVCLESCLKELMSAGACWIRPARREPFSAARLVAALVHAGWPPERVAMYGTDHATLSRLVQLADQAILYGGPDIQAQFEGMNSVTVHGPGRACAMVGPHCTVEEAVAWLKPLVASNAGRFCTNVGTVLCLNSAEAIATALADELDQIGPDDQDWPLASWPDHSAAEAIVHHLHSSLSSLDSIATRRPIVSEHRGRAFLAPTLIFLRQVKGHPLAGIEYPFPIAVVGTATREDCAEFAEKAGFLFERGM